MNVFHVKNTNKHEISYKNGPPNLQLNKKVKIHQISAEDRRHIYPKRLVKMLILYCFEPASRLEP